jgi:predicted RNase H-like HicB family nuclease
MKYFAIVHKDHDSAYGVTFPDLAGCFSAADTEAEIISNAIEALDLYFEDAEAADHPASDLSGIVANHRDDLADGAFIISVPLVPRPTKQVRANISIDAGMLAATDEAAKALGLTRSGFIAQAVLNEIRQLDRGSRNAA